MDGGIPTLAARPRRPGRWGAVAVAGLLLSGCFAAEPATSERPPSSTGAFPPSTTSARRTTTVAPGKTTTTPVVDTAPPTPPTPGTASATTVAEPPIIDLEAPPVVARDVPPQTTVPAFSFVSPWAAFTTSSNAGTRVELGCAPGTDAASLDGFLSARLGPLLGEDYQHVYPLGGDRYLWLMQDTFVDHTGLATRLDEGAFIHNSALEQTGSCFALMHGGSIYGPTSFEPGQGERRLSRWFWPMGGELTPSGLQVFWVEMVKDGYEPGPGEGLGWHPESTWLATYDPGTLRRLSFEPAANPGTAPIYGYAVATDDSYTYLFGNTFEQNLVREGGYDAGPHSATHMYLARVTRLDLRAAPEYRTADGWSADPGSATPISSRYWVENPMQPRYLDGVWVSATKVDGYWGERLAIDVAHDPWGPWINMSKDRLYPRGRDPLMNTYHAHVLPWRDAAGNLLVAISQNARNMVADAFPVPGRYRPSVIAIRWATPGARPEPTTTTIATTTTSTTTTSTTTTTASTTSSTTPETTASVPPSTVPDASSSTDPPPTAPTLPTSTTATTVLAAGSTTTPPSIPSSSTAPG